MIYDMIVIGAGASGMTAAACAADPNMISDKKTDPASKKQLKILLLEKNKKIGKKIYATGNGKCNIANQAFDINCYFSNNEFFPYKVIAADDYKKVISFFEQVGVLVSDENGYYYPMSRQASTVVWAFNDVLKKNEIEIHTGEQVAEISINKDHIYEIKTDHAVYHTKNVVLSCGGSAAPALGGTDSGLDLLEQLGVPVYQFHPALCKVKCTEDISELSGVRCKAGVYVECGENSTSDHENEFGEVQFTDTCISGIVVFNQSHIIGEALEAGEHVRLHISPIPTMNKEDVLKYLRTFVKNNPERNIQACLNGLVHEKLGAYIIKKCGTEKKSVQQLSEKELVELADILFDLRFEITDTAEFTEAQVARGGADTRFVNPETMGLKMVPGCYVTGELLDVDGKCGGYNLMWAVITGMKAGKSIYDSYK